MINPTFGHTRPVAPALGTLERSCGEADELEGRSSRSSEDSFERARVAADGTSGSLAFPDFYTRARNEADKIKGHFQAWTEKGAQTDQTLAAVLRAMAEIRRIGVGGSDLGSS